jgi:hypothetical protein
MITDTHSFLSSKLRAPTIFLKLVGGIILIVLGGVIALLEDKNRGGALLLLGFFLFIPGSYSSTLLWGAYRGWAGYRYSQVNISVSCEVGKFNHFLLVTGSKLRRLTIMWARGGLFGGMKSVPLAIHRSMAHVNCRGAEERHFGSLRTNLESPGFKGRRRNPLFTWCVMWVCVSYSFVLHELSTVKEYSNVN